MADRSLRDRAADIIEPHIDGGFKRRERAEGNADDLAAAGLLNDGQPTASLVIRERAESVLQCRHGWRAAETIAAELHKAGLLKGGHYRG